MDFLPHDKTLGPAAAQRWTIDLKALLFKGEIHLIFHLFDRYALNAFADYFRDHARRMQYAPTYGWFAV